MSTDERYSAIFGLIAKAKEKEGLDSVRLRNEIRRKIEAADKTFGTFLDLVESLQDIIPKEKQRYNAAMRALSKTSGLSRQNILDSADNRVEVLREVEKAAFSALSGFRDELKDMDSRLKKTRGELARLRQKIAALEEEEQEILGSMSGWERESKVVEQGVRKVFTDVGTEITEIKKKIEQFSAEEVPPQPITPPGPIESSAHDAALESIDAALQAIETEETSAPQETKWTKTCPLCGGSMNFHISEAIWKCYTCGNEESERDDAEGAGESDNASRSSAAPEASTAAGSATPPEHKPPPVAVEPSGKRPAPGKKACPACRKQMNMHEEENTWKCPFCNYQRREF